MRSKSYKDDKKDKDKRGSRNGNKREFDKDRKGAANLDRKGRDNDPNFYFSNAELADQAAQLSFQSMMGFDSISGYKIPSIMAIAMNPCPGVSYQFASIQGSPYEGEAGGPWFVSDDKHGINLMSSKLYTMLSTFSGRTSNYAPQDVAMMILAISSIAELSEHIRRAFGVALTYNPRNRNLPLGLIRTMGISASDLIAHLPEYRMRFNVAMTRINQIPLLDNIGFIRKSREIYQRIYMDSVSPMAQIFFYKPYNVWQLDETTDPNGSMLVSIDVSGNYNNGWNVSTLIGILETMITALLESSTLNLIYADLLNMANKIKVPVWQFDYLAENYIVMPEYNRNALLQMHNMRVMGAPINTAPGTYYTTKTNSWHYDPNDPTRYAPGTWTITGANHVICDVNKNNVVYSPAFLHMTWPKTLVDMDNPNPTIEDRIESLRFTGVDSGAKVFIGDIQNTASQSLANIFTALPDHYVVRADVFDNIDYTTSASFHGVIDSVRKDSSDWSMNIASDFSKISGAPLLYTLDSSDTHNLTTIHGDLDFYTEVDFNYVRRLNELMYSGLFDFRV